MNFRIFINKFRRNIIKYLVILLVSSSAFFHIRYTFSKDELFNNTTFIYSTTVVTIYFPFDSKHSKGEYNEWMKNIIKSVSSPLVIFTNSKSKDYILKIKPEIKYYTLFYIYEDAWDILKELEKERNCSYREKYLFEQLSKDPEKKYHNPNLYAVWNVKVYIMNKIAQENPYNSSSFLYTDIGAFRSEVIPDWPDSNLIESLIFKLENRVLFGQIEDFAYDPNDNTDSFRMKGSLIQAGFVLGTKKAIENYKIKYYEIHDEFLNKGMFVGKEQVIMNFYAFKYQNEVVRLRTWNINCSKPYDNWFFYQRFLGKDKFYKCFENKFSLFIYS